MRGAGPPRRPSRPETRREAPPPPAGSEIWLFIGESYARGAANDPANIPAGYPSGPLYYVASDQKIAALHEPCAFQPDGGAGLSPGGAFIWKRYQATGRPQILVNTARGGTTTAQWRTMVSGGGAVGWTEQAITIANAAIASTGGTLKGIVWMQGVNDAIAASTAYQTNTAIVEAACRAGITGAASAPFVFTQLQTWAAGMAAWTTQARWDAVRAEQALYTGANRYMVTIPTGTMTSDGLHPQSALNLAIAEAIRDVLAPVVP